LQLRVIGGKIKPFKKLIGFFVFRKALKVLKQFVLKPFFMRKVLVEIELFCSFLEFLKTKDLIVADKVF
jgi:hypothetical protein